MINVAIIGGGNIGSRHLQAVAQIGKPVCLHVMDVSEASLSSAKMLYEQVPHSYVEDISFIQEISMLPEHIDVAVIATSSVVRKKTVFELLEKVNVQYLILEKFLFPSIKDYEEVSALLESHSCKAWVNCGRRMQPFYNGLKNIFPQGEKYMLSVSGGQWGMGCNGIHMVDLLAYLAGGSGSFQFDPTYLDDGFIQSKRNGYVEFTGTLTGRSSGGSVIAMSSIKDCDSPTQIFIDGQTVRCLIDEQHGVAKIYRKENRWQEEVRQFKLLYQSQATGILAEELMDTGTCRLTSYAESVGLHVPVLTAFLTHYNRFLDERSEICPIT